MARRTRGSHKPDSASIISLAVRVISDLDLKSRSCFQLLAIYQQTLQTNWDLAKDRERIRNNQVCRAGQSCNGNSTKLRMCRRRNSLLVSSMRDGEQS